MCIFQLPAISVRRSRPRKAPRACAVLACHVRSPSVGEHREARQLPALEVLQRRAAAGADVPVGVLVEAELPDGGRGVPAADDRQPVDGGDGLRRPRGCRPGRARARRRPSGRSRRRCGRSPSSAPNSLDRARADVEAHQVVRDRVGRRRRWSRRRRRTPSAQTTSTGSTIRSPASASSRRQVSTWSASSSEPPDAVALRGEEREAHAAADEQPVDLGQQRLDDGQLVADLRAAEHDHVGPVRVAWSAG